MLVAGGEDGVVVVPHTAPPHPTLTSPLTRRSLLTVAKDEVS